MTKKNNLVTDQAHPVSFKTRHTRSGVIAHFTNTGMTWQARLPLMHFDCSTKKLITKSVEQEPDNFITCVVTSIKDFTIERDEIFVFPKIEKSYV